MEGSELRAAARVGTSLTLEPADLSEALRAHARAMGFSLVGVTAPDPSRHMDLYRSWLASGHHGEMGYLSRDDSVARRADLLKTMGDAAAGILGDTLGWQADLGI